MTVPSAGSRVDIYYRLFSKVIIDDNGCWIYTGGLAANGYGNFWWEGTTKRAHRLSYELLVGPIREDMTLDHLCRVRTCINPHHLEQVTSRENTLRSPISPASINAQITECAKGHGSLTQGKLQRYCAQCHREASLAFYYKNKVS